jgi:hypothetical protein
VTSGRRASRRVEWTPSASTIMCEGSVRWPYRIVRSMGWSNLILRPVRSSSSSLALLARNDPGGSPVQSFDFSGWGCSLVSWYSLSTAVCCRKAWESMSKTSVRVSQVDGRSVIPYECLSAEAETFSYRIDDTPFLRRHCPRVSPPIPAPRIVMGLCGGIRCWDMDAKRFDMFGIGRKLTPRRTL